MNILLAASEVVPYAKTGGLADVAGALPRAVARLGHNVRVVMPRYKLEKIEAITERLPGELLVPFNFGERRVVVYVDSTGEVPVYFIDAPEYFSRAKLYVKPTTRSDLHFLAARCSSLPKHWASAGTSFT